MEYIYTMLDSRNRNRNFKGCIRVDRGGANEAGVGFNKKPVCTVGSHYNRYWFLSVVRNSYDCCRR